jgi:hypothetical protein
MFVRSSIVDRSFVEQSMVLSTSTSVSVVVAEIAAAGAAALRDRRGKELIIIDPSFVS